MTTKRLLVINPLLQLGPEFLAWIAAVMQPFDELVLVVSRAEDAWLPDCPLTAGQRLERALPLVRQHIHKPFYLLPIARFGESLAQYYQGIKVSVPECAAIYTQHADVACAQAVLALPCLPSPEFLAPALLPNPAPQSRGLFLTRAQPFHHGHAACLAAIAARHQELVVVIAQAERSHQREHPATAGERLQSLGRYLNRHYPQRHLLIAAPYLPLQATNFYELVRLLPPLDCVYSNNPQALQMALSSGLAACPIQVEQPESGSAVRQAMINQQEWQSQIPAEVATEWMRLHLPERLRAIDRPEWRQ